MSSKTLYLGLKKPFELTADHHPIIKIIPYPYSHPAISQALLKIQEYSHIVFTSKTAVTILLQYLPLLGYNLTTLKNKTIITVGDSTAQLCKSEGLDVWLVPKIETAEGIISILEPHLSILKKGFIFWPHSALSRTNLLTFFQKNQLNFEATIFYTTALNETFLKPNLNLYDKIIFTSPSTVDAFLKIYGRLPLNKILIPIGSVTEKYLNNLKD